MQQYNPCGVAKLLGKVWEYPIEGKYYPYCSFACLHSPMYRYIPLYCDECGEMFFRLKDGIVHKFGKRNQQRVFCSQQCKGKYMGRNYGFQKGHKYATARV